MRFSPDTPLTPPYNNPRDGRAGGRPTFVRAAAVLAAILVGGPRTAAAGTAFVIKNGGTVLLAKNLDGPVGDGRLVANKARVFKTAFGGADSTPIRWLSKYGSLTFNQFGREFPLGGINEPGLVVESLAGPAAYPSPDARPSLNELQWIQYQLDTQRTVKDVLKSAGRMRISRLLLNLHFLIADRSGRTAVIEFTDGRMAAYEGSGLPMRVLVDDGYEPSVRGLNGYQGFGGEKTVGSGPGPADRFLRAAAALQDFVWPVPGVLSDHAFAVLRSVERPDTQWSIVYNLTRRLVFFKTRSHRRLKIVRLEAFDFSCENPSLVLPVDTGEGWVLNGEFEPYDAAKNRALLDAVVRQLVESGAVPPVPADVLRRLSEYPATCSCRP